MVILSQLSKTDKLGDFFHATSTFLPSIGTFREIQRLSINNDYSEVFFQFVERCSDIEIIHQSLPLSQVWKAPTAFKAALKQG